MDFSTILSRLDAIFSGTTGTLLIAALGVIGIVGWHVFNMRFASSRASRKSKSYQHLVIEPFADGDSKEPIEAMTPSFSSNQKQF